MLALCTLWCKTARNASETTQQQSPGKRMTTSIFVHRHPGQRVSGYLHQAHKNKIKVFVAAEAGRIE